MTLFSNRSYATASTRGYATASTRGEVYRACCALTALERRRLYHAISESEYQRLYVPSPEEATHPRCGCEGYPDWPGRASSKEGES
jgi:hypothetical protein